MKKVLVLCLLLSLWLSLGGSSVWAVDVGWMQKGVRVWYFGAVGSTTSSDAEEAYLFSTVNGNNVQVTKHSGMNHWGTANAPDTSTYSFLDKGPCWIHPQVLQTLAEWRHLERPGDQHGDCGNTHTYDSFKAKFSFPYLLLPIKALFDLTDPTGSGEDSLLHPGFQHRESHILMPIQDFFCSMQTSNGFVTVFFLLSEINYDFATQQAFAEDNGPHTGFKSSVLEQQMMPYPDTGEVMSLYSPQLNLDTVVPCKCGYQPRTCGNISSYSAAL